MTWALAALWLVAMTTPVDWYALGQRLQAAPTAEVVASGDLRVGDQEVVRLPREERRPTEAFLAAWQRGPATPPQLHGWTRSGSTLARRVAHATLRRRAVPASPDQIEGLIGLLQAPDWTDIDRAEALRTLAVTGGGAGLDRLASVLETLPSDAWRVRAVGVFQTRKSPAVLAALARCHRDPAPILSMRCGRALEWHRARRLP